MSSSTTPTVSLSSATPSASQSQASDGGGGPSSSLYLFTFLATLFLLLFVSSAIILRSFILRRRFRRRIEEAILAGVIPPTQTGPRGRRRAIGEKPKLWEARVCPAANDRWDTIVPVAVQSAEQEKTAMVMASAIAQGGERPAAAATAAAPPTPPTHDPPHPPSRRPWLRNLFAWRRGASSPANPPPISDTYEDSPGVQRQNAPSSTHDRLRLTVLIAMPDPRRPHADGSAFAGQSKGKERSFDLDYDEDDLPEMTLGMTELPYKDSITTTTKSS